MTLDNPNRSYYPALDGLRGLAILLILLYHNFNFLPFFEFAWAGVDLFFVLSGFLITDILLRTRNNKNYLRNFYIRRVLRIFPVYYLCIILFFLLVPYLSKLTDQYVYYSGHQFFLWTNTQNWLYIFYEKPNDFMLFNHFWSLSVEEQFYLVWPLIVLIIKDTRKLVIFIFIILIACILTRFGSWLYFGNGYINFHFQFMTRMDGLCIGCLIALWKHVQPGLLKKKMIRLVVFIIMIHILIFGLIKLFSPSIPHFSFVGYTSIAALFGLLVYHGIAGTGVLKKYVLENKWLKGLGKISYGLYVYHWPILVLFRLYVRKELVATGFAENTSNIILSVIAVLVAIAISWLSYNLFEKRLLALKNKFT